MSTAGPVRRRPRMASGARRVQVLAVARELFARDGFHHVSMDDTADRAAVSEPVLYRHFPSKLDLHLVVVEEAGADLLRALDDALATVAGDPSAPGTAVPSCRPQHTTLLAASLVGMAQTAAASRSRADGGLEDGGLEVDVAVDVVARLAWQGVAGLVRPDLDHDPTT